MSPELVGREVELRAARGVLSDGGLLTLLGPPGIGKSAIARFAARGPRPRVHWVDLDGAATLSEVAERTLAALGAKRAPLPRDPEALGFALARDVSSIVFDDADDAGPLLARVVDRWLALSPRSGCVITTCHRLGLGRETLVRVPPLELPQDTATGAPPEDTDGVRLFLAELERRAGPRRDVPLLTARRIVDATEGVPLAIVRAAAVAAVVGVEHAAELCVSGRLAEIPNDEFDTRVRHRTLAGAALAHWDSLGSPELERFASQLALFQGGFGLEAASAVTGCTPAQTVELLTRLVDGSWLVQSGAARGEHRFLGTTRELARARLERSRDHGPAVRRFVGYFASRAEGSPRSGVPLSDVTPPKEHDSARLALSLALGRGLADDAAKIAISLAPAYLARGPLDELVRLMASVESRAKRLPRARAGTVALLHGLALLFSGRRSESFAPFVRASELAVPADRATALSYMGLVTGFDGDFRRAKRQLARAERVAGSSLEPLVEARILKNAANVLAEAGDESALEVVARARACFRRGGDKRGEGFMVLMRASLLLDANRLDQAAAATRQAAALLETAGDSRSSAWAECILATIDREAGRLELGRERYRRSAEAFAEVKDPQTLGIVLQLWAALELELHAPGQALDLAAEACVLLETAGDLEHLALARGLVACAHAMDGQRELAKRELERARAVLPRRGRAARRAAIELLALCVAEPAAQDAALSAMKRELEGEEARSALRILQVSRRHAPPEPRGQVLRVADDTSWLATARGNRIELGRRPVMRRIVELLVSARERTPGAPVSAARLLKHAWPGEQIQREAALNRLYVTLTRLRHLGLDAIDTRPEGYLIRADVSVARQTSQRPPVGAR